MTQHGDWEYLLEGVLLLVQAEQLSNHCAKGNQLIHFHGMNWKRHVYGTKLNRSGGDLR